MLNTKKVSILFCSLNGKAIPSSLIQSYLGSIEVERIQEMNHGNLVLFSTVNAAIDGSIQLQKKNQQSAFQIGLHYGNVIQETNQCYGDSIIVATRLSQMASLGSVLLSKDLQVHLTTENTSITKFIGRFPLNHIESPLEVFALAEEHCILPTYQQLQEQLQQEEKNDTQDKLSILIVEDDMLVGTHISIILTEAGYEVQGLLTTGEMVLEQMKSIQPDLVLMDIRLKGELDGIDTAKQIHSLYQIPVIFLTANSDNATFERAKEAFPFAFITKPFKAIDLSRTIALATSRMQETEINNIENKSASNESLLLNQQIFIRDKDKMVKIRLEDIHYVKAERNYCQIFTETKNYLLSVPLKTFEKRLKSSLFERVHRSFLVNLQQIDELDDHYVYCCNQAIPISKTHKEVLSQRLGLI